MLTELADVTFTLKLQTYTPEKNNVHSDQISQKVASDLDLHCLPLIQPMFGTHQQTVKWSCYSSSKLKFRQNYNNHHSVRLAKKFKFLV